MTPADGHLVLRKARREWLPVAIILFVLFLLPFLAAAVGAAVAGEWAIAVVTGCVGGVPTVVVAAHLWRSRIEVTPDAITVRGAVIRRQVPRAQAAGLVRAHLWQGRAGIVDTVFVLDAGGRSLLRIYGQHYRRSDIDHLVAFLGLPATGPYGVAMTPSQLDALHPGLVNWYEAHPVRLGAYIVAVTVLCVVGLAVVMSVLASPM